MHVIVQRVGSMRDEWRKKVSFVRMGTFEELWALYMSGIGEKMGRGWGKDGGEAYPGVLVSN